MLRNRIIKPPFLEAGRWLGSCDSRTSSISASPSTTSRGNVVGHKKRPFSVTSIQRQEKKFKKRPPRRSGFKTAWEVAREEIEWANDATVVEKYSQYKKAQQRARPNNAQDARAATRLRLDAEYEEHWRRLRELARRPFPPPHHHGQSADAGVFSWNASMVCRCNGPTTGGAICQVEVSAADCFRTLE